MWNFDLRNSEYNGSSERKSGLTEFNVGRVMGEGVASDPNDIKSAIQALTKLNYYQEPPGSRMFWTEDTQMRQGLRQFQQDQGLQVDGRIYPDGPTATAMNRELQQQKQNYTRLAQANDPRVMSDSVGIASSPKTEDGAHLFFNGQTFSHIGKNGQAMKSWPAVSGRQDYQRPEFQSEKNKGPIPEGMWIIRRGSMQEMSLLDAALGLVGRGGWRGGSHAWGTKRFWLEPDTGTDTRGRNGFSIHGGDVPGSAGCIDLTEHMDDFADYVKNLDQDIKVKVKYGN